MKTDNKNTCNGSGTKSGCGCGTAVKKPAPKGFTLIEILIVVIILGILAAIVIPQFTNASTAAKTSAALSTAQTLRQQIALYKLQHTDKMPGTGSAANSAGFTSSSQFWTDLTTQTDATGAAWTSTSSGPGPFGPYMQSTPTNSLNGSSIVADEATQPGNAPSDKTAGFVYDFNKGTGTGALYATNSDFTKVLALNQ